jgi:hypothetical protein
VNTCLKLLFHGDRNNFELDKLSAFCPHKCGSPICCARRHWIEQDAAVVVTMAWISGNIGALGWGFVE